MKRFPVLVILALTLLALIIPVPVFAGTPPPSLLFSPFLTGMVMVTETGEIRFNNLYAMYLPDAESYSYHQYSPDDGGKLWATINDSDGEELLHLDFYALQTEAPYYLLTSYKTTDNRTGETSGKEFFTLDPGDYTVNFYVEDQQFYHFQFQVECAEPEDGSGGRYYLNGDWENWSYFIYPGADPEESLQWKVWLRDKNAEDYENYETLVELKRDGGSVLATSREGVSYNLKPAWVRAEFDLVHPNDGSLFRAKELLANDGLYTLTLKLDGELYGTWKFEIDDGKFVYEGHADREATDPLVFIEGGPDVFFYEKV